MKLLFVLPEYGVTARSGIPTFYLRLIPSLIKAGHTIDVCLAKEEELPSDLRQQTAIRVFGIDAGLVKQAAAHLPQFSAFPELLHPLARAFAAFNACKGGQGYDVVETTDWGSLYVPWLIGDNGPPVVVQLHSSYGQVDYYEPRFGSGLTGLITRLLETSLLGRAEELQSCGPVNAAEWSRLLNKDVHHIWPAWHRDSDPTMELTSGLKADDKGLVVGRIQSWKGAEVLCQAMDLLGNTAPRILWVGRDTPSRRHQQSMSAFLKKTYGHVWEKTIFPVGEMSREMTANIQSTAKFVIVPSSWDILNLTAIEAMDAGKVVICSEGAGACDLITHGENGFRFPTNDPRRLAKLLTEVDKLSAEVRVKIGQRARDTVRRELDPDRICVIREERYRRLSESKVIVRQRHRWLDSLFSSNY